MWSYYGSKSKFAKLYPKPKYDLIIEPFAGAAHYSVLHRQKNVILNEKYKVLHDIWEWLLNQATPEMILNNKDFYLGQDIRQVSISDPHRNLIGFCINRGSASPNNIVQKWSCQKKANPNHASTTEYALKKIAKLLPEIKHWKLNFGDYKNLPDVEATWFIDPPYQKGGTHYKVNDVNYTDLAEWCKSRKGQVIVCENNNADWLPFTPLKNVYGQKVMNVEVVYTCEMKGLREERERE